MKKTLIAVIAIVLLWLFFKGRKTTKTAKTQAPAEESPQSSQPVYKSGLISAPANAISTPVPAPASPINPETTYTAPPEIQAAIEAKQAAIWDNPNIAEAQAKEAELQRIEAERLAASQALREINQKIYEAQQAQQTIDAATLKAQQEAQAAADAANAAKITDLAYKAANSAPVIQYDTTSSPELERLNAFLAVKAQVVSNAMYDMQRQSLDNMIYVIEQQYKLAYQARVNGEAYPGQIDGYTRVAQSWETILKTQMATIEQEYVMNQAKEVASVTSGFNSILVPHPVTGEPVKVNQTPLIM